MSYYRGNCEICDRAIQLEEPYYVMPYGELICEDCLTEWAESYHRLGEMNTGFEEEPRHD